MKAWTAFATRWLGCASFGFVVACGDDGGTASGSGSIGVEGSKQVSTLTSAELGKICDYAASKLGGYGNTIECGGGQSLRSPYADQAECIADSPSNCSVTVAQYERCINDQSCMAIIPESCAPLFSCQ